ncbi:protein-S-isoprenylcysteine O-methyltransferase, putative [Hepatocystis sp. ex Piliocolobus tephrosceles]|nr:protein-S-isoprenylcysteine O-methyltransferase, putative [Hepatocystis sp. ex Piliocolobus tephrosceles]
MNVVKYMIFSFLLYINLLNYKTLLYFINYELYKTLYKKNVYLMFEYYLHVFLEYGFVLIYLFVSFIPYKDAYTKRSKYNYVFAKFLLIYFFFFFFHFLINSKNNFPLHIFYLAIICFHLSEFILSFTHNKQNYNYYNFLINPNYGYSCFFVLTLIEYYGKIFLFIILYKLQKYINSGLIHKLLIFNYFFFKNYIEKYGICTYSYSYPNQINIKQNLSHLNIDINETSTLFYQNKIIKGFIFKNELSREPSLSHLIKNDTVINNVVCKDKLGSVTDICGTSDKNGTSDRNSNNCNNSNCNNAKCNNSNCNNFNCNNSNCNNSNCNNAKCNNSNCNNSNCNNSNCNNAKCNNSKCNNFKCNNSKCNVLKKQKNNNFDFFFQNVKNNTIYNFDTFDSSYIFGHCIFKKMTAIYMNKKKANNYNLNNTFIKKMIFKYGDIFYKYDIIPKTFDNIYNYYICFVLLLFLFSLLAQFLRIMGIIHCSTNFSFFVLSSNTLMYKHYKQEHKLVTRGVYRYMRHPCYTGWFYYSLFLQLSLFNFGCFVLSFVTLWIFFSERIKTEELFLLECYGDKYRNYKAQTPNIYIPFIKGI